MTSGGLVTKRHLAGHQPAEVAVVLEATGDVGQKLGPEVGLEIGVDPEVVAVCLRFVGGPESGKHLRPAGSVAAP